MGVLDKIESKLGGNKHNTNSKTEKPLYSGSERKSLEQQAVDRDGYGTNHGTSGYGSGHNTTGYGTANDNTTYGSGTGYGPGHNQNTTSTSDKLRHPVQATTGGQYGEGHSGSNQPPGAYPDTYNTAGRSGHAGQYQDYGNDGYGQQSSAHKTHAVNPVDPRSVRGQNALADSSHHGQGYSSTGESGSRDYDNVDRSQHGSGGGIKNALHLGGHSKENHDAIPTAGGEKLGSGGNDIGRDHHHYGRDVAVAGGAAGFGEHEHRRHNDRSDDRHLGRDDYDHAGRSSNDQYGASSARSGYPEDSSHTDNSRHGGSGLGGILGRGKGNDSDRHGHHGRGEETSSGHGRDAQGLPTEKKLGGAYEAGYRDAMAHLEAEKQR